MENLGIWIVAAWAAVLIVLLTRKANRTIKAQRLRWQEKLDVALTDRDHALDHIHGTCQCDRYCPSGQDAE